MIFDNKDIQKKVEENLQKEADTSEIKQLSFIKIAESWYAKVPGVWDTSNWQSTLMVSAFPSLLEELYEKETGEGAKDKSEITIVIRNEWFFSANIYLQRVLDETSEYEGEGFGADYKIMIADDTGFTRPYIGWLCGVNTIVWGGFHPQEIFARVINTI